MQNKTTAPKQERQVTCERTESAVTSVNKDMAGIAGLHVESETPAAREREVRERGITRREGRVNSQRALNWKEEEKGPRRTQTTRVPWTGALIKLTLYCSVTSALARMLNAMFWMMNGLRSVSRKVAVVGRMPLSPMFREAPLPSPFTSTGTAKHQTWVNQGRNGTQNMQTRNGNKALRIVQNPVCNVTN